MVKSRVISSIVFNGKTITRGFDFLNTRPVGSLIQQVKIYNLREIDELVIYNIDGSVLGLSNLLNIVSHTFMPLAIGGGIKSLKDIEYLLSNGADKIILNSACFIDPILLKSAVDHFGSQAISVGVDFKVVNNEPVHFIENGTKETGLDLKNYLKSLQDCGAGEIIVNCIDRDGRQSGYDICNTLKIIADVKVPVVISGGAGSMEDFSEALKTKKIDAVCASSFYLFNRYTPANVKEHLSREGLSVRKSLGK